MRKVLRVVHSRQEVTTKSDVHKATQDKLNQQRGTTKDFVTKATAHLRLQRETNRISLIEFAKLMAKWDKKRPSSVELHQAGGHLRYVDFGPSRCVR
jgi:hypothetical protein